MFHAGGFKIFRGGYVGVDIFFVISGFLITSVIAADISDGNFSFAKFYERRIRRLFPPLLPVILFSWLAAFSLFSDSQLREVSTSVYAAFSFIANWYFLFTVSYFTAPGDATPLLHLWSLSIEEQFYFIFPVTLLLAAKLPRKWILTFVVSTLIISLAYAEFLLSGTERTSAFYNSFARFWELSVGAALALSGLKSSKSSSNALEITGFLLIVAAVASFRSWTHFPGIGALIPAAGTAMIIAASGQGSLVSSFLKSRLMVFIGLISYGLYLWHWPILVFLKYVSPSPSKTALALALCASGVLAYLSYRFIETPIRQKHFLASIKSIYFSAGMATIGLCMLVFVGSWSNLSNIRNVILAQAREALMGNDMKVLTRIEDDQAFYMTTLVRSFTGKSQKIIDRPMPCSYDEGNTEDRLLECLKAQSKENNVLVLGDSIGRDTWHALRRAYPETNFLMLHQSSCPPSTLRKSAEDKTICFADLQKFLDRISQSILINGIVISFSYVDPGWSGVSQGIDIAKKVSDNVILFGVSPTLQAPLPDLVKASGHHIPESVPIAKLDNLRMLRLAENMASQDNIRFVNVTVGLCPSDQCALFDSQQNPYFIDHMHMTDLGINRLAAYLKPLELFPQQRP